MEETYVDDVALISQTNVMQQRSFIQIH